MVAYYNRSLPQEAIEPDHPSIRGYENSYRLWLLKNKHCFSEASNRHLTSPAAQNRYGEVLEQNEEIDVTGSPPIVRPQPILPVSSQAGISAESLAHNFLENNRLSAFQRLFNSNHPYEAPPLEPDLEVLYDSGNNCKCCAMRMGASCDPHNGLPQSSHHHVTICVPHLNHFGEHTSPENPPHPPLPSLLTNHKIAQHQHDARECGPKRNISPQMQYYHRAASSALHQMASAPHNHMPHNTTMRPPPYGFHRTASDSIHHPNLQPPWPTGTTSTNPIKMMVPAVSAPIIYPVRTESVLCHGKQILSTTIPRPRVLPNGAYPNLSAVPASSTSNVYPFRQNIYLRETHSNMWLTSNAQKLPVTAADNTAGVTWCHTKRCNVSSCIDQRDHPCFSASSVEHNQEVAEQCPPSSRRPLSSSEPKSSRSNPMPYIVRNKLQEMNAKVSLVMDMCSYEKRPGHQLDQEINQNDSLGDKRENAIRVSVLVPNSFRKPSPNAEDLADDDWEQSMLKRTKQDFMLRARVLTLLWVLLGEHHLRDMGFPEEPVHRLLWTTVHVCCSVRGAKSAAAIPLDKDHNCGADMTCFRDHTHRFLEVCAPTREHWKRFGWAGLTVDAVMHNIYKEELEPMFRNKTEMLPPIVKRAAEYLQREQTQACAVSLTPPPAQSTTTVQNSAKAPVQSVPPRKKRGRPAKVVTKIDTGGRIERVMLWRFILNLLEDPRNAACIDWVKREEGIFRIYNTDWLARQWGRRHGNPRMTYEKMARAMRTYYRTKVLQPVPRANSNLPRKLVYKFNPAVLQKVAAQSGRYYNAFTDRALHYASLHPAARAQPLKGEDIARRVHLYKADRAAGTSTDSPVPHSNASNS